LKSVSSNIELKRLTGIKAADLIHSGMTVGIGTGSTVAFFIEELGRRMKQGLEIKATATSYQSRILCQQAGIPLVDASFLDKLDIAVDGADEIDPGLNAIKGGGAAHTMEKVIASMADRFILIADETKLVPRLLTSFPLPVEVMPGALSLARKRIAALGGEANIRMAVRKDGPVISENGNFILDISFGSIPDDLKELDLLLKDIPGLVETGLFLGMAEMAIIGCKNEVRTIYPAI